MRSVPPPAIQWSASSRRGRWLQAFSLVEVTLALGLVSFGVLAMVGVNATSWQILSQARDTELGRNIHRSVSASLLDTPFANLPVNGETEFLFFDEAGFAVREPGRAIYKARVIGQGGVSAGGMELSDDISRVFEVRIERSPGGIEPQDRQLLFTGPVVVGRREKQ